MISFKIKKIPTLFIKAFADTDVQKILDFVRTAACRKKNAGRQVLFIDTPITASTVEAVEKLNHEGFRVCFRDHHGIDGDPTGDRDKKVVVATAKLMQILGDDCQITVRRLHPACSTMVSVGEFKDAVAIIADPDPDGLTAAMKAAGISYAELDQDAALLDGEPHLQVTGSPISQLLAKGMSSLPSFDPQFPLRREEAQQELFVNWVKAVEGDKKSIEFLEAGVGAYDKAVEVARQLATRATEVAPGVVLADCVCDAVFDVGTLTNLLEQRPGCRVCVLRKSVGPIAALYGVQYSLSVAKRCQKEINLQRLLPPDLISSPELGVISNVSFLLHVSESVWNEQALPLLHKMVNDF